MAANEEQSAPKEGMDLLGSPTFTKLENGRFKCVETGHEVLEKDKESYSQSKRCRLGLIDYAVSHKKPPLNLFKQDPTARSKLVCKLTGDTVNKSEEHIWKHMNGKQFFGKLEKLEMDKLNEKEDGVKEKKKEKEKKKGKDKEKSKKKDKAVDEVIPDQEAIGDDGGGNEESEELDFWVPPAGKRWDYDDGGDRWGSDSESEQEGADLEDEPVENGDEPEEKSTRKKRKSNETGPSRSPSKKKKKKSKKSKKNPESSSAKVAA